MDFWQPKLRPIGNRAQSVGFFVLFSVSTLCAVLVFTWYFAYGLRNWDGTGISYGGLREVAALGASGNAPDFASGRSRDSQWTFERGSGTIFAYAWIKSSDTSEYTFTWFAPDSQIAGAQTVRPVNGGYVSGWVPSQDALPGLYTVVVTNQQGQVAGRIMIMLS
jgi:hypothetical protein